MQSRNWKTHNPVVWIFALLCFFAIIERAKAGSMQEHEAKLSGQEKQIEALEAEIRSLIKHKKHEYDANHVRQLVGDIASKHKQLQTIIKEYEEERLHVRFKHPDQNDKVERKYVRHKLKSIEDLEGELGLDGRLNRLKARIQTTFPAPKSDDNANGKDSSGSRHPASEDDGFEKVKLVK